MRLKAHTDRTRFGNAKFASQTRQRKFRVALPNRVRSVWALIYAARRLASASRDTTRETAFRTGGKIKLL
jgi:hypothetical protein